jgi:hypothetical protein
MRIRAYSLGSLIAKNFKFYFSLNEIGKCAEKVDAGIGLRRAYPLFLNDQKNEGVCSCRIKTLLPYVCKNGLPKQELARGAKLSA